MDEREGLVVHAPRPFVFEHYTDYANLPKISKYIKSARIVSSSSNAVVVDFEVQVGTRGKARELRRGRHRFVLHPPLMVEEEVLTGVRAGARTVTRFNETGEGSTIVLTESIAPSEKEAHLISVDPRAREQARAMISEEFKHRKRILEALASKHST